MTLTLTAMLEASAMFLPQFDDLSSNTFDNITDKCLHWNITSHEPVSTAITILCVTKNKINYYSFNGTIKQ